AAAAALATTVVIGSDGDERQGDRDDRDGREPYSIGLWGDLPYSDLQAKTGVPNLIADMNARKLAFTVHDGDLKVGSGVPGSQTPTTCSDAMYLQSLGYLNSLDVMEMFTPGYNDCTDSDRPATHASGSAGRPALPRHQRLSAMRRKTPVASRRRHLPDAERAGVVQQP